MLSTLADWWDAFELWLTQLPFGFQVLLATFVLVPLCWGTAVVSDRLVDAAAGWFAARRGRREKGSEGSPDVTSASR